ncbi:MAG: hypothetical protein K0R13_2440 [Propionibacteriaceae bacterium]|nr:hypothetical protein [Propionibacteriaceae bacterium]
MTEQRSSVPAVPTKTAATQRTSQRANRAIRYSAMREQLPKAAASVGNRAPTRGARLARRCPGRASEPASEIGRQRLSSASLSERSEQCEIGVSGGFLPSCGSLPLAADRARKPPTLSSLTDVEHVGSLLRSTAARDPVRATTTAADSTRDARAAPKKRRVNRCGSGTACLAAGCVPEAFPEGHWDAGIARRRVLGQQARTAR